MDEALWGKNRKPSGWATRGVELDQTALGTPQSDLLGFIGSSHHNPDLDCYLHLRPSSYSQETSQTGAESLRNSTDSQPDRFRENHYDSSTYQSPLHKRATRTL